MTSDFHNHGADAIAAVRKQALSNRIYRAHCRQRQQMALASNCGDDKDAIAGICKDLRQLMASLDSVSIAILLGAVLVMAGILSSLLALRFGAPLLLVFLVIGMVAGGSWARAFHVGDVRTHSLL